MTRTRSLQYTSLSTVTVHLVVCRKMVKTALQVEKKLTLIYSFADFHGINTPTAVNVKLPI